MGKNKKVAVIIAGLVVLPVSITAGIKLRCQSVSCQIRDAAPLSVNLPRRRSARGGVGGVKG